MTQTNDDIADQMERLAIILNTEVRFIPTKTEDFPDGMYLTWPGYEFIHPDHAPPTDLKQPRSLFVPCPRCLVGPGERCLPSADELNCLDRLSCFQRVVHRAKADHAANDKDPSPTITGEDPTTEIQNNDALKLAAKLRILTIEIGHRPELRDAANLLERQRKDLLSISEKHEAEIETLKSALKYAQGGWRKDRKHYRELGGEKWIPNKDSLYVQAETALGAWKTGTIAKAPCQFLLEGSNLENMATEATRQLGVEVRIIPAVSVNREHAGLLAEWPNLRIVDVTATNMGPTYKSRVAPALDALLVPCPCGAGVGYLCSRTSSQHPHEVRQDALADARHEAWGTIAENVKTGDRLTTLPRPIPDIEECGQPNRGPEGDWNEPSPCNLPKGHEGPCYTWILGR